MDLLNLTVGGGIASMVAVGDYSADCYKADKPIPT